MQDLLADLAHEFRRHRRLAENALASLDDAAFFRALAPQVNPPALIVKHLAGNLRSRWTEPFTTDGDKPDRDRDGEFVLTPADTRSALMAAWAAGWEAVERVLAETTAADFPRTLTIRGETHTFHQALVRGLTHAAYHVGQILHLARLLQPAAPWQTIPPGESRGFGRPYLA